MFKIVVYKQEISHNPYFNRWFSAIKFLKTSSYADKKVTILILIDGFLQYNGYTGLTRSERVTILILIDGFLQ